MTRTTRPAAERERERVQLALRVYNDGAPVKPQGRPVLPPEQRKSATIRERVTQDQFAEYVARGGKAWLLRELGRKARK